MNLDFTQEASAQQRDFTRAVLESLAPPWEPSGRYTDEEELFVKRETARLRYKPKLPHGDSDERKIVEKLKKLAHRPNWSERGKAKMAVEKWIAIDGWYYKRQPLLEHKDKEEYDWYNAMRKSAIAHKQYEIKWFAEMMLEGMPKPVANFKMDCKFVLQKPDGTSDRLVMLRNCHGEKTAVMVALPSAAFAQPSKFREWLLDQGGFCWKAGERELQDLHEDINNDAAWRTVKQVQACGWHPLEGTVGVFGDGVPQAQKGIWFLGDTAYDPYGKSMHHDEHGIYWFEGQGYMLGERGRESNFLQKKPLMRPEFKVIEALPHLHFDHPITEQTDRGILRAFFQDLCHRCNENLGGLEGTLAVGGFLAYAAAPEIFSKYRAFPGIWIHGQASSGKSTFIGWLMSLWGFDQHSGFGLLSNTSTVGLQMLAEQYSNLPVWLDEFRSGQVEEYKLGIIRSCCYRDNQAKFKVERVIRTSFVVSGEDTTNDAATRGRFPHVQVAESRRRGDHLPWFRDHEPYFFLLVRYILENRVEFARLVLHFMGHWMTGARIGNERSKLVHGVHYSAWAAMAFLLESHDAAEQTRVKQFIVEHAGTAALDVKSEFNVNVFWTDMMNCYEAGELDLKYFKLERVGVQPHPPDAPNQGPWIKDHLFIYPEPIIAAMQIYLAKQRNALSLKRKDLRDQLSKNPYWLPGSPVKRLDNSDATVRCWGFDLDLHPFGYQKVADDNPAYLAYLADEREGDPRKGPIYKIVHDLLKRRGQNHD